MEKLYTDEFSSGSASVIMMILLYRKLSILKWSPMPQPKQVSISFMISLLIISASSKLVTFLIFPRKGMIACEAFLVSFAPPAAESIRFLSYRPFLWLIIVIMRFDSQVLRYLEHWHVSIVSLLSNNGDGLYRLYNIFWFINILHLPTRLLSIPILYKKLPSLAIFGTVSGISNYPTD